MTTTSWWTNWWWGWLVFILISWLIMELASISWAHYTKQKVITDWTLSDTIRRWSIKYRWLAPITVGIVAFLFWHFFAEQNLPGAN